MTQDCNLRYESGSIKVYERPDLSGEYLFCDGNNFFDFDHGELELLANSQGDDFKKILSSFKGVPNETFGLYGISFEQAANIFYQVYISVLKQEIEEARNINSNS